MFPGVRPDRPSPTKDAKQESRKLPDVRVSPGKKDRSKEDDSRETVTESLMTSDDGYTEASSDYRGGHKRSKRGRKHRGEEEFGMGGIFVLDPVHIYRNILFQTISEFV